MDDIQDKYFKPAKLVDDACDILRNAGFKKEFIYTTGQAFLALMMVESRIVRNRKTLLFQDVAALFNEFGQQQIVTGLELKEKNKLTQEQFNELADKYQTRVKLFDDETADSLFCAMATLAAYGFHNQTGDQQ